MCYEIRRKAGNNWLKLQSVLFSKSDICNEESLYFHREGQWILFDGFFNLFYLEKHHIYCDIKGLSLELKLCGIQRVVLMHDSDVVEEIEVKESAGARLSFQLPYSEYEKGVFWFKVLPLNVDGWEVSGHYEADVASAEAVELAVNICTFRREPYITRNMKSLAAWHKAEDVDGKAQDVAGHMHVFIVDNGQTLSDYREFGEALSEVDADLIGVIPNSNTGGAGGFSRGMLEGIALKDELSLTHMLMMDDDAVFDPDLFVRLYGLLTTLKPEYHGITVGGALMREDYQYLQHAAGEWYGGFDVYNPHPLVDLRTFEACTASWMEEPDREHDLYGAWWCCCYHMDAITRENLPLPLFVHHDDIQFGLSQMKRGIVFLNGICVWHQGFELSFPGTKQYYDFRNTLITSYMYQREYMKKNMKMWAIRRFNGTIISYRYTDGEFIYRGVMDFLKGRSWLMGSDPEQINKQLMADYKKGYDFRPYDEIKEYVKGIAPQPSEEVLRKHYLRDEVCKRTSLFKRLSFNGWFLPGSNDPKVITMLDSPWTLWGHKRALLYEPGTGRGAFVRRDNKELVKALWRVARMSLAIDMWKIKGGKW